MSLKKKITHIRALSSNKITAHRLQLLTFVYIKLIGLKAKKGSSIGLLHNHWILIEEGGGVG